MPRLRASRPWSSTSRTRTCATPSRCRCREDGGIVAFLRREVLPYTPDACYAPDSVKIGYEVSFTRCFYKSQPLRPLEAIRADILALEREMEGLLEEIVEVEK